MVWSVDQVESLLETVLFESPDVAAVNAPNWVGQAASSSSLSSLSDMVVAMTASPEAGITEQVYRLYAGALGRTPSASEIGYYVAIAEKGMTPAQIADGAAAVSGATWNQIAADFSNSPEFQADLAGGDAVSLLYKNILGRTASAGELSFYDTQIQAGTPMPLILQDFVNSPEFQLKQSSAIVAQLDQFAGVTPPPPPPPPVTGTGGTGGTSAPQPIVVTGTGAPISVDGGSSVTITDNVSIAAAATGGTITVGATTQPTGAVSITENVNQTDASGPGGFMPPVVATSGAITVSGGTSISIALTLTGSHAALIAGTELDLGDITLNGGASTTSVTLSMPVWVLANTYDHAAITGVAGVTAVPGGPGVTEVDGVTAVTAIAAGTAVAGFYPVGQTTINDAGFATHSTAAGTITSLTLTNGGNVAFNGDALTTLDLSGGIGVLGGITIDNSAAGAATNTALTVNADSAGTTITDTNNEITVLDVITSGSAGSGIKFVGTGLTEIHVSGTQVNYLGTLTPTLMPSLTAITVSGSAGLTADISAFPGTTDGGGHLIGASLVTVASTGTFTLTLDATATEQQSFTGGTGTDIITIGSDVTQYAPIAAGSATNNELILTSTAAGAYTLAGTGTYATGFSVLGIGGGNVNGGAIDLAGWASHFQTIDVLGEDGQVSITHFAGSTIEFSNFYSYFSAFFGPPAILSVSTADSAGASDSLTILTNGSAGLGTVEQFDVADAAGNGIGTLNVVGDSATFHHVSQFLTVNDNGLSLLDISGGDGFSINTLNETSTPSATLTIHNVETNDAGSGIGTLNDAALNSVTVTGTNATGIGTINTSVAILTLTNSGSSSFSVGTIADNSLSELTLSGNVALGQGGDLASQASIGLQDNSGGVVINASSDNAHIGIVLGGPSTGGLDDIAVGNGNNYIVDKGIANISDIIIQVGSGSNYIVLGQGAASTSAFGIVGLASHSAGNIDEIVVGTSGGQFSSTAVNVQITGAQHGDILVLPHAVALTAVDEGILGVGTELSTLLGDALSAGHAVFGNNGTNTFIVETSASGGGAKNGANTTMIELMGVHTLISDGTSGTLIVNS